MEKEVAADKRANMLPTILAAPNAEYAADTPATQPCFPKMENEVAANNTAKYSCPQHQICR
jgi:hypothetical protein